MTMTKPRMISSETMRPEPAPAIAVVEGASRAPVIVTVRDGKVVDMAGPPGGDTTPYSPVDVSWAGKVSE